MKPFGKMWLAGLLVSPWIGGALASTSAAELCQAARMLLNDAVDLAPSSSRLSALKGVNCGPVSSNAEKLTISLHDHVENCEVRGTEILCEPEFVRGITGGNSDEPSPAMLFLVAHELGHLAEGDRGWSAFSSAMLTSNIPAGELCGMVSVFARAYPEELQREERADEFALELLRRAFARGSYLNVAAPSAGLWSLGADIRQAFLTNRDRARIGTWPVPADEIRYHAEQQICEMRKRQTSELWYRLPGSHPDWTARAALIAVRLAPETQSDAPQTSPWGGPLQDVLTGFADVDRFMLEAEAQYFVELRDALLDASQRCLAGALSCPPTSPDAAEMGSSQGCEPLDVGWSTSPLHLALTEMPATARPSTSGPIAALDDSVLTVDGDRLWVISEQAVAVANIPCQPTALAAHGRRVLAQCSQWQGLLDIDLNGVSRHLVPSPRDRDRRFPLEGAGTYVVHDALVASYVTNGPSYMVEVPASGQPTPFPAAPALGCSEMQQAQAAFPWRADDQSLLVASVGDATVQVCADSDDGFTCEDPSDSVVEHYLTMGLEQDLPVPEPFLACGPDPIGAPVCIDAGLAVRPLGGTGMLRQVAIPDVTEDISLQVDHWCRTRGAAWLLVRGSARSLLLRLGLEGVSPWEMLGRDAALACSDTRAVVRDGTRTRLLP